MLRAVLKQVHRDPDTDIVKKAIVTLDSSANVIFERITTEPKHPVRILLDGTW
jgi:hypothetical protein